MKQEEIEKQAEEYTEENGEKFNAHLSSKRMIYLSFQDGAKWGYEKGYEDCRHYAHDYYKPKWHDLRENPNDLPEEGVEVLVLFSNYYDDNGLIVNKSSLRYEVAQYIQDEEDLSEWYWVNARTDDMVHEVIAWCELPQFKDKE